MANIFVLLPALMLCYMCYRNWGIDLTNQLKKPWMLCFFCLKSPFPPQNSRHTVYICDRPVSGDDWLCLEVYSCKLEMHHVKQCQVWWQWLAFIWCVQSSLRSLCLWPSDYIIVWLLIQRLVRELNSLPEKGVLLSFPGTSGVKTTTVSNLQKFYQLRIW